MAVPRVDEQPADHYHHAPEQTELEKALKRGQQQLQPYGKQLLAALLVVVVVAVVLVVWRAQAAKARSAGWDEFLAATNAEELEGVATKNAGSPVADWARLQAGRTYLQEGLNSILTDRSTSDERLKKAEAMYRKLVDAGNSVPPEVREESLYGLATTLEALSSGDTQPAIDVYDTLLKEFPTSNHRVWVETRIKELKKPEAQEFYAWFRQTTPKPEDRSLPFDLQGVQPPPDDIQIPDIKLDLDSELLQQIQGGAAGSPALPPLTAPGLPGPANPDQAPAAGNPEGVNPPAENPTGENVPAQNPPAEANPPAANVEPPAANSPPPADNPPAAEQPAP